MSSSTENRLSYASSPESDLEISPPPAPRLVKSSSDPSIATTQDNMDRDDDMMNHMSDAVPPPYTSGYGDSKYGFSSSMNGTNSLGHTHSSQSSHNLAQEAPPYPHSPLYGTVPELPPRGSQNAAGAGGTGGAGGAGGAGSRPPGGVLLPAPPPARPPLALRHNTGNRPSAQERLFGSKENGDDSPAPTQRPTSMVLPSNGQNSLDNRHNNTNSYDGSYNYSSLSPGRLGPNAPDDLKVAPPPGKFEPPPPPNPTAMSSQSPQRNSNSHEHNSLEYRNTNNDNGYRSSDNYRSPVRTNGHTPQHSQHTPQHLPHTPQHSQHTPQHPQHSQQHSQHTPQHSQHNPQHSQHTPQHSQHTPQHSQHTPQHAQHTPQHSQHTPQHAQQHSQHPPNMAPMHARGPSLPASTNDHAKYSSRTNSVSQADYGSRAGPAAAAATTYKPVPPPKPKHYRPPDAAHTRHASGVESSSRRDMSGGCPPYSAHQHSLSQPSHYGHHSYHQAGMYGGQVPQSPPHNAHRAINLPHNPNMIDLAGNREQRGSAFELYRKPQHAHNLSSADVTNSTFDETFSPKTKKKLSKKPSFIKNAVLDLFRSKSKKVSRQKSLCESDLQRMPGQPMMLRREKSDLSEVNTHMRNTQIRNQMLQRSNSSCEKPSLRPILKRQSSFCDDRSGAVCTVRDYDTQTVVQNLRRQNSMCEIETEPKVTPLLRRQNSLIEYNRRGAYGQNFNMITKIDPIYQRQQQMQHEPFSPTQPLPPEPTYQSKEHLIYDPIPKPRRTYASLYDTSSENPYATRSEVSNQSFENPYGSRQMTPMPLMDPPYATRADCIRENPYATRSEVMNESPYATKQEMKSSESFYGESPYSTKEQLLRQRLVSESPYSTKEEMLRQRFSESPYGTKEEMLKQRMQGSFSKESPYSKRTYDPPNTSWSENAYGVTPDRRLQTPVHFPGRVSPMSKCMSEPPYASKAEMVSRLNNVESPYACRSELVRSSCSENHYGTRPESADNRDLRPSSAECAYVSRQEILSQKAALVASRESTYGMKLEDKLAIIKQRNQAKKEMIYQTRKEANESDSAKIREPLYVSKRELKDSIIYESHQETKEDVQTVQEDTLDTSARSSPYELSDANHLARDPVYQSKAEVKAGAETETFKEIDFSQLRLTESQTDSEKEKEREKEKEKEKEMTPPVENAVLPGEPIYVPRLHGKPDHISNALKSTASPVPYESTVSMETQYASECSMNFENQPQSTPYTSQDLEERASKPNRTVTFCEQIAETSQENSENISAQNETTVINNQVTVVEAGPSTAEGERTDVEPEGPHTTWGIFDSEGGMLEDRQWGVSLVIPPKAIAPGIKQKIYFTVSDPRLSQRVGGPPIDLDNGEAMLSPLVMCGPQGLVFRRPVTLRLPHCANAVPSLGLTIKATDTEAHLSTDWDQIHLPATTTLNTVAVKVDHF